MNAILPEVAAATREKIRFPLLPARLRTRS
jgi:hypothetical protein